MHRRWGPERIAYLLGMHPSTVHKVLSRYCLAKLSWLDGGTGRVIRRYEHARPGDMIHVGPQKLVRIPDGGGHRVWDGPRAGRTVDTEKPAPVRRIQQRQRDPSTVIVHTL